MSYRCDLQVERHMRLNPFNIYHPNLIFIMEALKGIW